MAQLPTRVGKRVSPAPASIRSLSGYSSSPRGQGRARRPRGFAWEGNLGFDGAGEAREAGTSVEL